MSYTMRETQEERSGRDTDLALFAKATKSEFFPLYEKKYKLDAVMTRNKRVVAFVEHKNCHDGNNCLMNLSKVLKGVELAQLTGIPFIILARRNENWLGWWAAFEIRTDTHWTNHLRRDVPLKVTEDSRKGHDNPDDTEPCYWIPWDKFTEVK
jgi:hypothetical protein